MQQIVTAWRDLGLKIEQIAEQFDLSEDEVRAVLFENCSEYRKAVKGGGELDELLRDYKLLAKHSEVDGVRERALKFLINEHKGRNDIEKETLELKKRQTKVGEIDLSLRIAQFNETLRNNRVQLEETLKEVV